MKNKLNISPNEVKLLRFMLSLFYFLILKVVLIQLSAFQKQ